MCTASGVPVGQPEPQECSGCVHPVLLHECLLGWASFFVLSWGEEPHFPIFFFPSVLEQQTFLEVFSVFVFCTGVSCCRGAPDVWCLVSELLRAVLCQQSCASLRLPCRAILGGCSTTLQPHGRSCSLQTGARGHAWQLYIM